MPRLHQHKGDSSQATSENEDTQGTKSTLSLVGVKCSILHGFNQYPGTTQPFQCLKQGRPHLENSIFISGKHLESLRFIRAKDEFVAFHRIGNDDSL